VGAATTLAIVTVVAMVSFTDLTHIFGVAGSYLALATLEGQIVQPLFVGRRLDVNPLVVFLALWFGGLFWGVAGILLATPILVTLKVLAEHSERGKPMLEFLNRNAVKRPTNERVMREAL
jgi:predicted PurR-regulated permease PerM